MTDNIFCHRVRVLPDRVSDMKLGAVEAFLINVPEQLSGILDVCLLPPSQICIHKATMRAQPVTTVTTKRLAVARVAAPGCVSAASLVSASAFGSAMYSGAKSLCSVTWLYLDMGTLQPAVQLLRVVPPTDKCAT